MLLCSVMSFAQYTYTVTFLFTLKVLCELGNKHLLHVGGNLTFTLHPYLIPYIIL